MARQAEHGGSRFRQQTGPLIDDTLTELVAHLREHRTRLRQQWAERIGDARLLARCSALSP